jgi:hypothetical protein
MIKDDFKKFCLTLPIVDIIQAKEKEAENHEKL